MLNGLFEIGQVVLADSLEGIVAYQVVEVIVAAAEAKVPFRIGQ